MRCGGVLGAVLDGGPCCQAAATQTYTAVHNVAPAGVPRCTTCLAALSLQALSQALSFNTVLTSLELPCNNISGEGALFFATALRVYNHTLRTLDLQGGQELATAKHTRCLHGDASAQLRPAAALPSTSLPAHTGC